MSAIPTPERSIASGHAPPRTRPTGVIATLLSIFALVFVLSLLFGTESTSVVRAFTDVDSLDHVILFRARLPRVLLAAFAGAGLSAVGAALQALLRNPLAEPYLLGVSGGAALGATMAILGGLTEMTLLGAALVPLAALGGGLLATMLVYSLARRAGSVSGMQILLSGIIVNAMASALVTFAKTMASASRTQALFFWLVGFIDVPTPFALALVAFYVLAGFGVLWLDAGRLNLLSLGEEQAAHLGLDARALVRRVFFASSLVVGAVVSLTGLIGFVGLVVPHVVRRVIGADLRLLLPGCLVSGATVLVLADLVARASFAWLGAEPPVGAVTAMIGGPFALALLRRGAALR